MGGWVDGWMGGGWLRGVNYFGKICTRVIRGEELSGSYKNY